jgi:hypothetical protein
MKRLILSIFILVSSLEAFKIDRVILSSNENQTYLDFWPLVAEAWQRLGIKPTLALIGDESLRVDESYGDVIRIKPIPGVSTVTHAQVIRLLLPIYFEDEISIISDIDMVPCSDYVSRSVAKVPDDKFVVYRDRAYGKSSLRFPMCYNAGKGCLFKSIFNVNSIEDIPNKVKEWVSLGHAWDTDEIMLYKHVRSWQHFATNCVFLRHGHQLRRRIDRGLPWGYNKRLLKMGYYNDAHCERPISKSPYKEHIEELARDLGLSYTYKKKGRK